MSAPDEFHADFMAAQVVAKRFQAFLSIFSRFIMSAHWLNTLFPCIIVPGYTALI